MGFICNLIHILLIWIRFLESFIQKYDVSCKDTDELT